MKSGFVVAGLILVSALVALAKDPPSYDKAVLLSMSAATCGTAEKGSKTVAGEILGTDGEHKNTEEVLCQEYVLQGDRIVYHVRPTDLKHPKLLPVGENVEYRIHKDKMYILDREGDTKEREYSVTAMQVRPDGDAKDVKDAKNLQ
jgi:hypothetical protein